MTSNRRSSLRFRKVRYLDTSEPSMARRSTRPWERRHLLSTDWGMPSPDANGNSRNPGEIGRGRGCILRGIVLFGQNTVLFFQNRIEKLRTPPFVDGGWETIISLRSPP